MALATFSLFTFDLLDGRRRYLPVGVTEVVHDFKMVEQVGLDQFDRLACGLHGFGEVGGLAFEFVGLQRPVGQNDRRVDLVQVPLGAHGVLERVGKRYIR